VSLKEVPRTAELVAGPAMAKDRRRPGRPDRVSANLVPLLRTPEAAEVPVPASWDEDARLAALRQLDLLDTAPAEAFDRITRMASRVAWSRRVGAVTPAPLGVQAMRTEIGRPSSSMRLSAWTATSTSVARRRSVRERSPSPITCLNLPMAASARARLV